MTTAERKVAVKRAICEIMLKEKKIRSSKAVCDLVAKEYPDIDSGQKMRREALDALLREDKAVFYTPDSAHNNTKIWHVDERRATDFLRETE